MTIYILTEDMEIVAAFTTRAAALTCAQENELRNFHIQECTVRT
jgi:hypothetical protein